MVVTAAPGKQHAGTCKQVDACSSIPNLRTACSQRSGLARRPCVEDLRPRAKRNQALARAVSGQLRKSGGRDVGRCTGPTGSPGFTPTSSRLAAGGWRRLGPRPGRHCRVCMVGVGGWRRPGHSGWRRTLVGEVRVLLFQVLGLGLRCGSRCAACFGHVGLLHQDAVAGRTHGVPTAQPPAPCIGCSRFGFELRAVSVRHRTMSRHRATGHTSGAP